MALRKSSQLLPKVFQTSKNRKFLNATVDQLISEKRQININSFVGRTNALNYVSGDGYLTEHSNLRQNYQLEPAVVYRNADGNIESVNGILDILNSINFNNGDATNQNKLFSQEYYNWAGFVDFDKLVNYGEYFWLPSGPDSVQIFTSLVDTKHDYAVYREGTTYEQTPFDIIGFDEGKFDERLDVVETGQPIYRFDNQLSAINPILYLARGGEYTFKVEQPGVPFWIQTEIGLTGVSTIQKNVSTRDIKGITNNGEDDGIITWLVPETDDQNLYTLATTEASVDLATDLTYKDIHNAVLSAFIATYSTGVDGLTELNGKTIIFINKSDDERDWNAGDPFDGYPFDSATEKGSSGSFDPVTGLSLVDRYSVFTINIKSIGGTDTITLAKTQSITSSNKVHVKQGTTYGNREFYKNTEGKFDLIPPITASNSTFYYQDSKDVLRFGKIVLVDIGENAKINITEDILGKKEYASPNNVKFTNGLKVEFNDDIIPSTYANRAYYIEGVGTNISLIDINNLKTPESYTNNASEGFDTVAFDSGNWDGTLYSPIIQDYIVSSRASLDNNAWTRTNRWFHRNVIEKTAEYNNYTLTIDNSARAKRPIIEFDSGLALFNMGITSKPSVNIIDITEVDAFSNINGKTGYFADGIALLPGMTICFTADPDVRKNIYRVDFIDEDAVSTTSKIINLVHIDSVIANDCLLSLLGATQQGKMYWYQSDTLGWKAAQQKTKINQEPLFDVFDGDHTSFGNVIRYPSSTFIGSKLFSYRRSTTSGADTVLNFGLTYKNFNNIGDILFDNNFISDTFQYTKSTGNVKVIVKSGHIHQYKPNETSTKVLLNSWQKVLSDSKQWQIVQHEVVNEFYTFEIGSNPKTIVDEVTLQVFVNSKFKNSSTYTQLTINDKHYISFTLPLEAKDIVIIRVYSDALNKLGYYEVAKNLENNADNVDFSNLTLGQARNHLIEISRGIPTFTGKGLGANNIRDLDYKKYPGKILQHSAGCILAGYLLTQENNTIVDSIRYSMEEYTRFKNNFIDNINKLDLDLRDISSSVDKILSYMAGAKTTSFPFYYSDMLPWGSQKTTTTITVDDIKERKFEFITQFDLTTLSTLGVLVYINRGITKTLLLEERDYTFDTIEPAIILASTFLLQVDDVIEIVEYSNTDGSFVPPTPTKLGLYLKFEPGVILDDTYQTGTSTGTGPFKIYATADSSFSQLGQRRTGWFYPLYTTLSAAQEADTENNGSGSAHAHKFDGSHQLFYMPDTFTNHGTVDSDNYIEYANYTPVIQGHDGSCWVAYKDLRDEIIIEYEKRIYNNIKTQYDKNTFDWSDILAGYFRNTFDEFKDQIGLWRGYFGSWAFKNRVDYQINSTFDANNSFTWNYSQAITNDKGWRVPGNWRGIYRWLYDTDTPHRTPWEMLGLSRKPSWWSDRYGEPPYTSGNTILWEDLRDGKLYSSAIDDTYITLENYKRSTLINLIPVDEQGNLRSPNHFAVQGAFSSTTNNPWVIGDHGPAETAWRRSSEWPFAAQLIGALIKPAKYFSLMFDTNLIKYNSEFKQILQNKKTYRAKLSNYKIHSVPVSTISTEVNRVEGFNQFIYNYMTQMNYSVKNFQTKIQNLQLNLCYPFASYTDKKFLKILIETASPTSSNENIFVPDEDYEIVLHKSPPLERIFYSGVNIINRSNGYEIRGYDIQNPFFKIIPSLKSPNQKTITVGNSVGIIHEDSHKFVASVPYGTVIGSKQQVVDFLTAYNRYLVSKGIILESVNENGDAINFVLSAKEFLFWTEQNWDVGNVFNLSPVATQLIIDRPLTTIDDIVKTGNLRNSEHKSIRSTGYNVERIDNKTTIIVDSTKNYLYSASINPIQYEHYLVLKNKTIFNDIIYQPELGNRQERIKLIGSKVGSWNGTIYAPGFVLNENKFSLWQANTDYKKSDIISFRNKIYAAAKDHDGVSVFDFEKWIFVENMKTGLQQNLSNKAHSFTEFYDFDTVNLESDVDKKAKGQIGFRARDYLKNLGITDISQVKFYQGLLKTKGTPEIINKLVKADLTNLDQEINFYEEWGFRVGEYGSIDSNQVIELIVDESKAQNNPTVVQLLNDGDTRNQNYITYKKKDIYKIPNNYSKNVLLTRSSNVIQRDLIGAGYPRLDDIAYTIFDLENIATELDQYTNKLGRGSIIWSAKSGYNWDILRVTEIDAEVISITNSVNEIIVFETNKKHSLAKNDWVLIKSTNNLINGFKKVSSIIDPIKFTVNIALELDDITGSRLPIYKLKSTRFSNIVDIAKFTPLYGWNLNELAWVDSDENDKWAAYQKKEPWLFNSFQTFNTLTAESNNGTSLDISNDSLSFVSGAPGYGTGTVVPYLKDENGVYGESNPLVVSDIGSVIDNFGTSVAAGNQWHCVGAPDSDSSKGYAFVYYRDGRGTFNFKQALYINGASASDKFGFDCTVSKNDRFLFISAPGANKVYAYELKEIAIIDESVTTITGNGSTTVFTLTYIPDETYSLNVQDTNGKVYLPYRDFNVSGTTITFTNSVANGVSVIIRQNSHYIPVATITGSDVSSGDQFGYSIDCDPKGETLIIGSPYADVADTSTSTVYPNAGEAYVFHHIIETFTANGIITEFTTTNSLPSIGKVYIEVDGVEQAEATGSFGGYTSDSSANRYTISSNTITFRYIPSNGAIIRVYTCNFSEIQKLDQNITGQTLSDGENFGFDVAIDAYGTLIAVGAPGEDETNPNTGSAFVFVDEGLRFGEVISARTSSTTTSQQDGNTIFVNDYQVTLSGTTIDPADIASAIDSANISGVSALLYATDTNKIQVVGSSIDFNKKLKVRPGTGKTFREYTNFKPFVLIQKINHPVLVENENFGRQVTFDKYIPRDRYASQGLVITSDRASTLLRTRFDLDTDTTSVTYNEYLTTFDADSTKFVDRVIQSGAAYVYDLLESSSTVANPQSVTNPPQYAYGQQLQSIHIDTLDQFGSSASLHDNNLMVGSKLDDKYKINGGSVYRYENLNRESFWKKYRTQTDKVDVGAINRVVTYNKKTEQINSFVDIIDIFKQKLPGKAAAELDYITPYDPAVYSTSIANNDSILSPQGSWNDEKVGRVWWDLTTCRVIEYEQGDIDYRVRHWNQFFPGSSIDIYEWFESAALPSEHVAAGHKGAPKDLDNSNYSTALSYNSATNTTVTRYYYWITGRNSYPNDDRRQLSTENIRQSLEDPRATGIKYLELVAQNTFVLNNIKPDLSDKDMVLSVNYDVVRNEGILHSEFDLVSEGDKDQIIPTRIWNKIVDSLSGADAVSNIVPDPTISVGERYGIHIRPRQSIFKNRLGAIKVLVDYSNAVFKTVPVTRQFNITGLTQSDPVPTISSGDWDKKVANIVTRNYLNTQVLSVGYTVLVESDETLDNLWTIYTLQANNTWFLSKIQAYDTSKYWDYITWYASGYNSTTIPQHQVSIEPDLLRLTANEGELVKVLSNDAGNISFFKRTSTGWDEVIIENGTIAIRSSLYNYASTKHGSYIGFDSGVFDLQQFDRVPQVEMRKICDTIKNNIFINTLAIKFNELFFRLIEYSLHENKGTNDWVFKSSFVRVLHKLRDLTQYPTFKNDNSTFIESFINEVKPYHTQIREYISKFDGDDTFQGDVTDFDVHAFYDTALGYFRKPSGDYAGDENLWPQNKNKSWSDNRGYYLNELVIHAAGTGYIIDPTLTISAPDIATGVQATAKAITNSDSIVRVQITNKGSGYTKTPTITLAGAGSGCVILPRVANDTNREFDTTIKFDRITYASTIKDWAVNTSYNYLDLVAYYNLNMGVQEVYKVDVTDGFTSGITFSVEDATGATALVAYDDASLANNADRIAAYYVPSTGMIGDDLALLQSGTEYTGVKMQGPGFDREPGFDSAAFDNTGYDDFEIDLDGLAVLSGASAIDSIIKSNFTDLALGTRPEDINVEGGGFVDTYSSHAPEEIIPGIVFDTLDMEIYTDPSDDFAGDGNSFPVIYRSYIGDGAIRTFSYASTAKKDDVDSVFVWVGSTPQRDITVNYLDRTVTLSTAPAVGTNTSIYSFGVTGEEITHEETFIGDGSTLQFTAGVPYTKYTQSYILIDGVKNTTYTITNSNNKPVITLNAAPNNGAHIHLFLSSQAVTRDAFTKTETQTITLASGTYAYDLSNTVKYAYPYEGNMIVELGGYRLRPSNAKHHTLDGSTLIYRTPTTASETASSVTTGDIRVTHIDRATNTTTNLAYFQDYTVDSYIDTDSSTYLAVTLRQTYNNGDDLTVSVLTDSEYFIESSGTNIRLLSSLSFSSGDKLYVTTFSNHDPLRIQTKVFIGQGTDIITVAETFDSVGFDSVTFDSVTVSGIENNKFTIDRTPTNANYIWITVDGIKLHSGDYSIDDVGRVDLEAQTLTFASEIIITHFSENIIQPMVGYRMINNMLGTYEYFRLAADNVTILTKELNPTDTKIYVNDATKLSFVAPNSKYPGVVFVGNERVTYWEISYEDNYLYNVRRGTNGTRFATIHRAGTNVVDSSEDQRLPATNTHTKTWYDVGSTTAANGKGLQSANTVNAKFLKAKEAFLPNWLVELAN